MGKTAQKEKNVSTNLMANALPFYWVGRAQIPDLFAGHTTGERGRAPAVFLLVNFFNGIN